VRAETLHWDAARLRLGDETATKEAQLPDLLERVRAEIRERLDASRAAVQEYRRLEAALAALDRPASARVRPGGEARAARASGGRRRSDGARKRAPRGANREAVLRVVGERPGITTSELAAASGVAKRTLYSLLSTLSKQGQLERQELPGGQTGYRVPEDRAPDVQEPEPTPPGDEPAAGS
jgi:hypothetical protein